MASRGVLMLKKLILASVIFTNSLLALGPTIECRFAALTEDGNVGLSQLVAYTLDPLSGVVGEFDPYEFEISVFNNFLTIGVYLDGEPLSGSQIPVINVVNLPVGATVFGVNTIFHDVSAEFVSLQYDCRKVLW